MMNAKRYCISHPSGLVPKDNHLLVVHATYCGPDREDRAIVSILYPDGFYYHDVKILKGPYGKYLRVRNHKVGYDIRQPIDVEWRGVHNYRDLLERRRLNELKLGKAISLHGETAGCLKG